MSNIEFPEKGDVLSSVNPSGAALQWLARRRSTLAKNMTGPGPDASELATILKVAARVPDHRKLAPFRFITFEGDRRAAFGKHLGRIYQSRNPDFPEDRVQFERERFERAPVVVAVISSPDKAHITPVWEQELCAGAVCMNLLLAAQACGYAGQWLTEWYAFDREVDDVLGLDDDERVAGYIYLGTATEPPIERPRPDMSDKVSAWRD